MRIKTNKLNQVMDDLIDMSIESEIDKDGYVAIDGRLSVSHLFDYLGQYDNGIVTADFYKNMITIHFPHK